MTPNFIISPKHERKDTKFHNLTKTNKMCEIKACSTLLGAARRCSTLAVRRRSTPLDAARRCSVLLVAVKLAQFEQNHQRLQVARKRTSKSQKIAICAKMDRQIIKSIRTSKNDLKKTKDCNLCKTHAISCDFMQISCGFMRLHANLMRFHAASGQPHAISCDFIRMSCDFMRMA